MMDSNLIAWQMYFVRTGKDVFQVLESAITVAALSRPKEFFQRRDEIAQLLFARKKQLHCFEECDEGSDDLSEDNTIHSSNESDSDVGSENIRPLNENQIGNVEINCSNGTNAEDHQKRPRHIIRIKLPPKPKKEEQLQALKLEEANPKSEIERSHKNTTQIRPALEESEAKCDGEEKSCRGREETKAVPEQVQNVTAKSSKKSRERKIIEETEVMMIKKHKSMCLNEKALQVKLETSKRKLQEGYKQFESAKKKIRMIELKDLPQKGVGCRPPVNRIQGHCRPLNRTRCSYIR